MDVIDLREVDASMTGLVGGKAVGLAEMITAGERVPAGFCLTTTAHAAGTVPRNALLDAHARLGGGPVAVRSSATAEDLPDASFAGQLDTLLHVQGADALVAAVEKCWASLHTERATSYRAANGIDHRGVGMAVVVQRMVDAAVAGVMFTANPVTGCRTETVVEAAPGTGDAVVDGTAAAERHVLDGGPPRDDGWVSSAQLDRLRRAGQRLQDHFGCPKDIEWAIDQQGTLRLLQSRPITTLFPLPPDTGRPRPRVYLEFGHVQGMLRPFTPMGMSVLRRTMATAAGSFGVRVDPDDGPAGVVGIDGRLYGDLTDFVRDSRMRRRLPEAMAVDFGPRAQAAVERVLTDPRFAPHRTRPFRPGAALRLALRVAPGALAGVTRSLARPDSARARMFRQIEELRRRAADPPALGTAAERLTFVEQAHTAFTGYGTLVWPIMAGMLAAALPARLLDGVASDAEVHTVLGGMPHNVTTEMDLALWHLAERAHDHRDLLLTTPPTDLAAMYHAGALPDIGLAEFLDRYGHRAAAEIDVGVPRWEEDPAPVFTVIANYLRVTDTDQAPDRRFRAAAARAEDQLAELLARARRRRPLRGRIAGFLLRRARSLAGLREAGKFAGLYPLAQIRRQLLLVGADLADRGLLQRGEDVMFLTVDEARAAVHHGTDHRQLVASRRADHERELRRPSVPVAVLSDGTDVEALAPPTPAPDGALTGTGAAAGRATGPARVVRDPADAHVEPGEILVAPTTDPGWTPLFLTAGALVTETGATMAHGPTVAREYGIPAVICVRDATRRISTGQVITVDGAAGTVTLTG